MDIETATNDRIEQQLLRMARPRLLELGPRRWRCCVRLTAGSCRWGRGVGRWVSGCGAASTSPPRRHETSSRPPNTSKSSLTSKKQSKPVQIGFDRAVAVGRFAGRDDTFDMLNDMAGFDIAGIRHRAARRRRMTRVDEEMAFNDRYVIVEPNLDESVWRLNGRLPGFAGRIVIDALEAKADTFPKEPGQVSRAARNADALWAISLDTLYGTDGASIEDPTPLLTVFVDANEAAAHEW